MKGNGRLNVFFSSKLQPFLIYLCIDGPRPSLAEDAMTLFLGWRELCIQALLPLIHQDSSKTDVVVLGDRKLPMLSFGMVDHL